MRLLEQLVRLQIFNKFVDFVEFTRNTDVLRTMRLALATTDAMVRLTKFGHASVESDQIVAAKRKILLVHNVGGQRAVVLTFIIMAENAR